MGARSTASEYRFDRYWRNLRTFTLHDPVDYKVRAMFIVIRHVPDLQQRGLLRVEYTGITLRQHLGLKKPN